MIVATMMMKKKQFSRDTLMTPLFDKIAFGVMVSWCQGVRCPADTLTPKNPFDKTGPKVNPYGGLNRE